ncbi:MAG: ATP-binding cassette domain-containing protein, partial [Gammaproteobacteria bacterium]
MAMLEARNLGKHFGGVAAINGLSLSVEQGELRGVIGPNGAGKTTLFNVISGIYRPTKGEVLFEGERIDGRPASEIARRGLVRTFQRDALIHDFTVIDNVTLGRHLHAGQGLWGSVFGSSRGRLKARR